MEQLLSEIGISPEVSRLFTEAEQNLGEVFSRIDQTVQ